MTLLLRTLTHKSKLGFGTYDMKDLTIRQLIDCGKARELIKMYYTLGMINYADEVLDELCITEKIGKPGKIKDNINNIVNDVYSKYLEKKTTRDMFFYESLPYMDRKAKIRKMHFSQSNKKEILRSKNQGKIY